MADSKISQLVAASTPLAGTEVLPIVQSSSTVKVTVGNVTAGRDVAVRTLAANTTLSAWVAPFDSLVELKDGVSMTSAYGIGFNPVNAYIGSGGWTYKNSSVASLYQNGPGTHSFATAPSGIAGNVISFVDRLSIANAGDVTVNTGNLLIGTAAKGIDFSANANAQGMTSELLTWYEEGTFTPTIVDGGFSSLSTIRAKYTRIGRCVYIVLDAQLVGTGNGNTFKIGGLPFTVSTNGWAGASFFADKINTANYNLSGLFASATTELWTVINVAGTSRNGIGTDYSAGGINFAGFYFV